MNRFALFAGDVYYPLGGYEDYVGSFETAELAIESYEVSDFGWAHVVDVEARVIVAHQYELEDWKRGTPPT